MFTWLPFYEKSLKHHLKISSKWPTLSTKALHYVARIHYIHSVLFGGLVKSSAVAPHWSQVHKTCSIFYWWQILGRDDVWVGFTGSPLPYKKAHSSIVYFTNCSTSAMHVHRLCTICHESILVRLSYFLFFSFSCRNSQVIRIGLCSAWEILMFSIIKKKRGTSFVSFFSFYQNWDKSQCERVLAKYFSWKCYFLYNYWCWTHIMKNEWVSRIRRNIHPCHILVMVGLC